MWRLLPFLFICYMFSYLDRINISFAKLQMVKDLGLSDAIYGLGAGIFFLGYLIFEIPSNLMLLKIGPRIWISRIMVTWGIISAAMLFVKSPASFYAMRFLLGVAEAGFFPAILLYLTYWFPTQRRAKVTALFLTGIPMSGVVGGPLSGWIMDNLATPTGLAGWQWLFLLEGIPTILFGVIAFFYLDDKVVDAKWLSTEQKDLIARDLAKEHGSLKLHSIKEGLTNPKILLLSAVYFFYAMGLYGITFWLPTIVKASGFLTPLSVGLFSAIPYGAATIAMILVGRSSDRTGERRWHLAMAGIGGAVGLWLSVMFASNTIIAMTALTIGTMGVMTTISQFWTIPPALLGGSAAAVGIALANSVGSISGVVSPYVIGWIQTATGTTGSGVLGLASCMVVGSLLVFALPAHQVNIAAKKRAVANATAPTTTVSAHLRVVAPVEPR